MILLIDTSTSVCRLFIVNGDVTHESDWDAGRELARGLLGYLEIKLREAGGTFEELAGIGIYKGPGSFTGLRIGITVANTLADTLEIPIVGSTGDGWKKDAAARLQGGENDRIVLPLYGSEAHITAPRK